MSTNPTKQAKVTRFLDDEVMSESVFEVIQKAFLKPKPNADVNMKAAQFMSLELLSDAWKELEKYRTAEKDINRPLNQVGM